jgi:hypothetical protein
MTKQTTDNLRYSCQNYFGKKAVLTTKHEKLQSIARPLKSGLGLELVNSSGIDTDTLGTFTGEVERVGSPRETALKKARLGMDATGIQIGLASEGSFGPHPLCPFIAGTQEFMVFIDDKLGIEITEQIISTETNFCHAAAASIVELEDFLNKARFPSHALIVRPNDHRPSPISRVRRIITGKQTDSLIIKGIAGYEPLAEAIQKCRVQSSDGKAYIETDMRAHVNPTRQRVIRRLAIKLARRLQQICPQCECPGWGITGLSGSLPCGDCGIASEAHRYEDYSCAKCNHKVSRERRDGLIFVEAAECHRCNP